MTTSGHVHWYEGLFLQQHHLQWFQHQMLENTRRERRLAWAYPYGLIDARISTDALENMLVRFEHLTAVMKSGVEVSFPDAADLPPLDIKAEFERSAQPFVIELGVPYWSPTDPNTVESGSEAWRAKRIYRVAEMERADENVGGAAQVMQVRRINARLLLPRDDRTNLETIPVCRVSRATGGEDAGKPRLDEKFVPACMALSGSSELRRICRDIGAQVEASRKELVVRLTRAGWNIDTVRPRQFEQLMRLVTLNRFAGSLPSLVHVPGVPPFEVYLQLRELLGELAALRPDRDQAEAPAYDHENPKPVFEDVIARIRSLMGEDVAPSFIKLDFKKEDGVFGATLTDEHCTRPNEYFLGIKTRDDPRVLAKLVENVDQFKFMAKSMARLNIFGVKLQEERHPPLELPSQAGLNYFRLVVGESQRMWDKIKSEKQAAIIWPGVDASDFVLSLYMTVPPGGEK